MANYKNTQADVSKSGLFGPGDPPELTSVKGKKGTYTANPTSKPSGGSFLTESGKVIAMTEPQYGQAAKDQQTRASMKAGLPITAKKNRINAENKASDKADIKFEMDMTRKGKSKLKEFVTPKTSSTE